MSFGTVKIKDRRRAYSTNVDVDVEVSLADVASEDLIDELQERGEWRDSAEELAELLQTISDCLQRRDYAEIGLLVERHLYPKWSTEDAAVKALKAATGAA